MLARLVPESQIRALEAPILVPHSLRKYALPAPTGALSGETYPQ